MITEKQIKLIWVLAKQLGVDGQALHELIHGAYGKTSLKSLDKIEAKTIIDRFILAGGKVKKKSAPRRNLPPNVVEMVTRKQLRFIETLEKELGWQDNPERLRGFVKRTIKAETVRTKKEGIKVIQGLKSMVERKQKRREHGKIISSNTIQS